MISLLPAFHDLSIKEWRLLTFNKNGENSGWLIKETGDFTQDKITRCFQIICELFMLAPHRKFYPLDVIYVGPATWNSNMETWFWIVGWSLSILTMTGNGFIIFLVCRRRRLRTKTNAFIFSLAVADFCAGLSAFPPLFLCDAITGCDPKAFLASGVDYLRWLFMYASVTNLCCLVLERYVAVVKPLRYLTFMTRRRVFQMIFISWTIAVVIVLAFILNWLVFSEGLLFKVLISILMFFLEFLPCCGLIFCFGSMYYVIYKHERATRILTKQLPFNQRFLFRVQEKSAVKIIAIVIGLFLVAYSLALRCSFIYILKDEKPCDDQEYKIPLLVLNSAINPVAYAIFKRDINMEVTRYICCFICKKRNHIEPINENNSFILRSYNT